MQEAIADITPIFVFAKEGDIYCKISSKKTLRLTAKNIDSNPILSPNKRVLAFTRKSHRIIPNECLAFAGNHGKYGNEIWIYDFESKKSRRIVANNFDYSHPKKQIVNPSYLQFSPDSKTLYFITSAWATSGAVHAVNADGSGIRYIVPGNQLEVISKGGIKVI